MPPLENLMRVLLAEKDPPLATFVAKSLEAEIFAVDVARDASHMLQLAADSVYDLLLLDTNLTTSVISSLLAVRRLTPELMILVITNGATTCDRVQLLNAGADDLIAKPLSFNELIARVKALLRRRRQTATSVLSIGDLTLDRTERVVERAGRRIELTAKEFALLEFLMRNAGGRLTRAKILEQVWDASLGTMTNVVDVYINYLRKKVDSGFSAPLIHTVRGVGYELKAAQRNVA